MIKAGGNITRAAEKLGISKPWIMLLLRRHGLNDYARELRLQNGQPFTGRPLKTIRPTISAQ